MGRIARLLSFLRLTRNDVNNSKVSVVKCDPGGGVNVTVEHYADAGDDSSPLPTDYVALQPVATSGGEVALGYADTINTPKAQPGDKRIYSRDNNGVMIADIWLKNDGTIIIDNGVGQIEMQPGGNVIINTVVIDTAGNITTTGTITAENIVANTSLKAATKEIVNHIHTGSLTAPVGAVSNTGPSL